MDKLSKSDNGLSSALRTTAVNNVTIGFLFSSSLDSIFKQKKNNPNQWNLFTIDILVFIFAIIKPVRVSIYVWPFQFYQRITID